MFLEVEHGFYFVGQVLTNVVLIIIIIDNILKDE